MLLTWIKAWTASQMWDLSRSATCVHSARLSGGSAAQGAARMGLMSPVAPARFCNAESAAEAKEYFHIDFGLGILRPRHYSPRARLLEKIEQRSVA